MKKTTQYFVTGMITAAVLTFSACKDDETLPPIDGFNNSNEVASTNLVAHWTFENTTNEDISKIGPTKSVGNTFITGLKGQALNLSAGYLVYPTIAALSSANALPSVTVSIWVQIANNGTLQSNIFGITQSTSVQSDWNTGPLNVYVETGNYKAGNDTLQLHANFATYINSTRYNGDNVNNYGVKGTDFQPFANSPTKWFHYVMRYDGSGSLIDLYANGVKVSNNKFAKRTYSPGGVVTGLGNIVVTPPTQVVIGTWPTNSAGFLNSPVQGWQSPSITAGIDEIRVFSTALSDKEIGSLYKLELAGR